MRLFISLMRTSVILLLTVRVLASPLALRPESLRVPSNYRFVVRICAWPALRPHPSISATSLVPYSRSKGPHGGHDLDLACAPQALLSSAQAILSRLIRTVSQGHLSEQHPVHLRC